MGWLPMLKGPILPVILALAGCGLSPDSPDIAAELARYPGVEAQIRSYYGQSAAEVDFLCNDLVMGPITKVAVVEATPAQLKLAITYFFSAENANPLQRFCLDGINTRLVTFEKAGQGWALVRMSGEITS